MSNHTTPVILILTPVPEIADLLLAVVECAQTGRAVIAGDAISDFNKLLEDGVKPDLVICEHRLADGDSTALLSALRTHVLVDRLIFCDSISPVKVGINAKEIFGVVAKSKLVEELIPLLEQLPPVTQPKSAAASISGYAPIPLESLRHVGILPCDVFLRLSPEKIIKISHEGDSFGKADRDNYKSKDIDYLYVRDTDTNNFLQHLARSLLVLVETPSLSVGELNALGESAYGAVRKQLLSAGIKAEALELAQATCRMAMEFIHKQPELRDCLRIMLRNKGSFSYQHSMATALVVVSLLRFTEWDAKSIEMKLALAALLHDLVIEDEELCLAHDSCDLSEIEKKFGAAAARLVRQHGTRIIELVSLVPNLPNGIEKIVAEHHEMADGSGYPRGLQSKQINALSAYFIICHGFVTRIISSGKIVSLAQYLREEESNMQNKPFSDIRNQLATVVGV